MSKMKFLHLGAVLPSTELPSTELPFAEEEEETCGNRYADCTANEDCCGVLRCMDFGKFTEVVQSVFFRGNSRQTK